MTSRVPEYALQKALIAHLHKLAMPGVVYFSVPNEGRRSFQTAAHLKAMGLLPGAADITFLHQGKGYCLELKAKGGKQTDGQRAFENACIATGIPYAVTCDLDDALAILRAWGLIRQEARAA